MVQFKVDKNGGIIIIIMESNRNGWMAPLDIYYTETRKIVATNDLLDELPRGD